MQKLDEHRKLSEQDYGPWLDAATLYKDGDRFLLKIEGGYSQPYDEAWYELASEPVEPLSECFPGELWANPDGDDSELLLEDLGVVAVKLDEEPEED